MDIKTLKSGLLLDDRYALHLTGPGHPESPDRYRIIAQALKPLIPEATLLEPRVATLEELTLCHPPAYCQLVFDEIQNLKKLGIESIVQSLSTGDVMISPASGEVALLAVGGVLNAVDTVVEGKVKNAFCPV